MTVTLEPVDKGLRIPLQKPIVFIGRHPDCDVVLRRSRKVSRKHCCIVQANNGVIVRDLGSLNGVLVNGVRVRKQAPLRVGDELCVGDVRYIVTSGERVLSGATPAKTNGRRKLRPQEMAENQVAHQLADEELSQDVPVAIPDPAAKRDQDPAWRETPDAFPLVDDAGDEDDVIPLGESDEPLLDLRESDDS